MAISDTIESMRTHLSNAYTKLTEKQASIPTNKNLENLESAIDSISVGVDTSDATATADDILLGKTAYAKGEKLTGTIETYAGEGGETVSKLAAFVDGTLTEITADDLAGATKISEYVFYQNTTITSINIPDSATSIERDAFNWCLNLKSITIPNSVKSIGTNAFNYCQSLTSVTIPDGVEAIENSTFGTCQSLTSVIIPNSVKRIAYYVFQNCSSLTRITIPSAVTSIGGYALQIGSSTNKATITMLPTTPPTIQSSTFYASYLEKIIVPAGTGATYKAATNWSNFADYIEEATA